MADEWPDAKPATASAVCSSKSVAQGERVGCTLVYSLLLLLLLHLKDIHKRPCPIRLRPHPSINLEAIPLLYSQKMEASRNPEQGTGLQLLPRLWCHINDLLAQYRAEEVKLWNTYGNGITTRRAADAATVSRGSIRCTSSKGTSNNRGTSRGSSSTSGSDSRI